MTDHKNTPLTKKQLKFLKSRAHALKPVVMVGQHGLSDAVYKELEIALNHHELIKVKVAADNREARASMRTAMCKRCKASVVQTIGSMVVLFRQNVKDPVIDFKAVD